MKRRPSSAVERFQSFMDGLWDGSSIRLGSELTRADKAAHFGVLVFRSFIRNRCPVHAYALSYTTLLALVPMLAVVLSLTSSLLKGESEERIGQFIDRLVMTVVPAMPTDHDAIAPIDGPEETESPSPVIAAPPAADLAGMTNFTASLTGTNEASSTNQLATATTNAPTATQKALAQIAKKPELREVRREAARNIREFIQNTWSGTMGTVGTVLLLYIAITMLARIEDTFNDIWGVARGRTWFMRIVLYWAVISLVPLLLIVALTLGSGPHFSGTRAFLTKTPYLGSLIFYLAPVAMLWLTFSAFYKLVPNTKIEWAAALAGGAVCAILWHVNNALSVYYVARVASNFKIYGSLGLVPVFMIGLYFAWFFLLFGAQVAYAWQNRSVYLQEKLAERVDQRGREFVALRLMTTVGQCFQSGEAAASVSELSETLGVPSRLTLQIMRTLQAAQLVSEVHGPEPGYLPARPLETITCHDVLLAMRTTHGQPLPKRDEPATNEVLGEFERIQAAERQAATSVTLAALVNRAQTRLQLTAPVAGELVTTSGLPVEPGQPATAAPGPNQATPAEPAPVKIKPAAIVEPASTAKPDATEFVSVKLPSISQPTDDNERTFPL